MQTRSQTSASAAKGTERVDSAINERSSQGRPITYFNVTLNEDKSVKGSLEKETESKLEASTKIYPELDTGVFDTPKYLVSGGASLYPIISQPQSRNNTNSEQSRKSISFAPADIILGEGNNFSQNIPSRSKSSITSYGDLSDLSLKLFETNPGNSTSSSNSEISGELTDIQTDSNKNIKTQVNIHATGGESTQNSAQSSGNTSVDSENSSILLVNNNTTNNVTQNPIRTSGSSNLFNIITNTQSPISVDYFEEIEMEAGADNLSPGAFAGKRGDDPELWLSRAKSWIQYRRLPNESIMPAMSLFLKDNARIWYEGLPDINKDTLEHFSEAFLTRYLQSESNRCKDFFELIDFRQTPNQNVEDYIAIIEKLARRAEVGAKQIAYVVLKGLLPEIRVQVLQHADTRSLEEVKKHAIAAELASSLNRELSVQSEISRAVGDVKLASEVGTLQKQYDALRNEFEKLKIIGIENEQNEHLAQNVGNRKQTVPERFEPRPPYEQRFGNNGNRGQNNFEQNSSRNFQNYNSRSYEDRSRSPWRRGRSNYNSGSRGQSRERTVSPFPQSKWTSPSRQEDRPRYEQSRNSPDRGGSYQRQPYMGQGRGFEQNNFNGRCQSCGSTRGHRNGRCAAQNLQCFSCGRYGHIRRMCRNINEA